MQTVIISSQDEKTLKFLQEALSLPSKAQVIHRALEELKTALTRQTLAQNMKQSVLKCTKADLEEHQTLTGVAVYRLEKE